jgi:small subunit ribosomal protein S5
MNAKTSKPDRKRNDRGGRREPSEFSEATLSVDRVTRVVKGGRRMRFRAIVVVGNKKGKVGLGTGKATEVQAAVKKAVSAAKRAMIRVPMKNGTIPHAVELKFKAARLRLMPAAPGTGVIAGGALRVILEQAGVKDVLSKRFGSRNKLVNAQTSIMVLQKLKQVAGFMEETQPAVIAADGAPEAEADKSKPVVTEISKGEAQKRVDDARRSKVDDK